MKLVRIERASSPNSGLDLKYCDTFFSKLMGLMFRKEIQPGEGIILAERDESRLNTSIHMLFMRFDITVLWLDKQLVIVDKILAKKWRPFYFSKEPAQYVIEIHQSKFEEFNVGERLIFKE